MVVAFGATERGSEPDGGDGTNTVGSVFGQIFLGLQATFGGNAIEAVEGGGDLLVAGGIGE